MRKLFLSLYLAVTVGLLVISWTTEWLWQEFSQDTPQDKWRQHYVRLLEQLHQTQALDTYLSELGLAQQVIPKQNFALLPEQEQRLQQNQSIQMYDQQAQLFLYLPFDENQLRQIGPLHKEPSNEVPVLQNSLLFLSYLLLAFLIFFWSRPLWRDLNRLKQQNRAFGEEQRIVESHIQPRSVLYSLAESQQRMAHKIKQLMSLQKQMTHAVSHDIRTPLARLKFSIAILQQKTTEASAQSAQQEMLKDVAEIELLVDEMLTYGRLETDQTPLNKEHVNVSELINNLVDKLALNSPVKINRVLPEQVSLYCDGHYLERALQNLITNAIRHSNSQVTVELTQNRGIEISVNDDGDGVKPEDREKVWRPFSRLETSRNRSKGGFGLGLAIVAKIVEWHQGEVAVTDSSFGGARFIIRLPVIQ